MNKEKIFLVRSRWQRGMAGFALCAACVTSGLAPDSLAEERTPLYEETVQKMLEAKVEEVRKELANDNESVRRPVWSAVVYADTEDPDDNVKGKYVVIFGKLKEVRGTTTCRSLSFREVYVCRYDVAVCGIIFKPSPPYEAVSQDIEVKGGEVINLGRIVFKKTKAEGSASLHGTVTDMYGKPMPDVLVSARDKKTETNGDGNYRIDGFGLGNIRVEAKKKGYFGEQKVIQIKNMDNREFRQDMQLFRPCEVVLHYAVSARESDSFSGLDIERGKLTLTLDSMRTRLGRQQMPSPRFQEFVEKTGAALVLEDGRLRFDSGAYYPEIDPDTPFDSIEAAPEWIYRSGPVRRCPLLVEGNSVVIRGFGNAVTIDRARSDYCAKVLVEKFVFAPPPENQTEASLQPRSSRDTPDE